jgi:cation diffusion facilitator CzcD-associated flavoprotein CzcO
MFRTHPPGYHVVAHLDRHAHQDGIQLRLNTAVDRLDSRRGGWLLRTSAGDIDAPQVVVATGCMHSPHIPDWAGQGRLYR